MIGAIYYAKPNGRQPLAKWKDKLPANIKADIDARINKLQERGIDVLINTKMVDWLGPKDLYELRNRALGWRIAFYFDRSMNTFILLCGWKKQRNLQPSDIAQAREYMKDYLMKRKVI